MTTDESNLQLLKDYLSTRYFKYGRKTGYRNAILSYSRYVGAPLSDADKSSLQRWFNKAKKDGLNLSTIVMYAFCLRTSYRHALQCKGLTKEVVDIKTNSILDNIPLKDLSREVSRRNNGRDKLVTPEEFKKLLLEAKRPRTKALLVVLYESGC
ncbi:hypothetical protein GTO27_03705 [Candidatus Bathyarchaeota archaeon]|nr:hypothetical protein [Candidatus Bathyarchaeota archaeon]